MMKRSFTIGVIALAAIGSFGALVYVVLLVANVSTPASTTVEGLTPRRAGATASAGLALLSAISGALAHARSANADRDRGRRGAFVAVGAGVVAAASGCLNLATAAGGPGSGNGVVGGAAALVLGLVGVAIGARLLSGKRRPAPRPAA